MDRFSRFCRARGKTFKQRSLKTFSVVRLRNVLLQIFQRAAHTVLGVYLKRTCSRVTSASNALGVLNDHDGVREGHYRVSRGTLPLFLYSFHWLPWTLYMLTVCVCGTVTDVETNPLTHSLSGLGRCSSPAHWQYYGINAIFYILWPLCSSTIVHSLSSSNKLFREMRVFGLSRFLAHFSFFLSAS